MVRCCCQVFNTEEGACRSKELTDKLSTIFSENVRRDAVKDEPMSQNNICNVRGYSLEVEWSRCPEKLQFSAMVIFGVVSCPEWAPDYNMVDVCGHVEQ